MAGKIETIAFLLSLLIFTCTRAAPTPTSNSVESTLTYITLEEHYDSPSVRAWQEKDGAYDLLIDELGTSLNPTLRNISVRLPSMDKTNIRIQVPTPTCRTPPHLTR